MSERRTRSPTYLLRRSPAPRSGTAYRCGWRRSGLVAVLIAIAPTQVSAQAGLPSATSLDVTTGSTQVAATAALTGTVTTANETDIRAGGSTIVLTLTEDTWGETVGGDNQITTFLIFGLTSAQSEATGWNAVVRGRLTSSAVDRTSATVVTITLPAFEAYAITADETIMVTIPSAALVESTTLVEATPTFSVSN